MKDNTTKISLTIQLEGSTLVRKSEPKVIKSATSKKESNPSKKGKRKGAARPKEKSIVHYPLVAKPARLHVNMGIEAYNYMISVECPHWVKPKIWAEMTEEQRLEAHLQRMCEHHKGKSFTYVVLED